MNRINKNFSESLLNWHDVHGRKSLPWQQPRTPYRVWLSEIMLQQTQVQTVIPYFMAFITRFPEIYGLAYADLDEVLTLWAGLGYYSRARNLHQCAQIIVQQFAGRFPEDPRTLQSLPGIGRSTAAAIASLAFEQPTAIMDGNAKRVLSRYFLIKGTSPRDLDRQLWQQADACMPTTQCSAYTQAIMDMGATCCTRLRPNCDHCPLKAKCLAYQHKVVDDYPPRKLRATRPIRQEQFLLFYTEDRAIYLEQRPTKGIWGGLWCLPAIGLEDCPLTHLHQHYATSITEVESLMTLKHGFTHFQLDIHAKSIKMQENLSFPGRWVPASDRVRIALPKPIKTIIDYFLLYPKS